MTINYTTLLGLTEPVTGTQSGTWGSDINTGLTDYVEAAIAGAQVISGSQTAVTLSVTTGSSSAPTTLSQAGSGATGSSQYQIIRCTGNPAGLLTITAPASDKTYVVINATSTSQSVKIVGAGPTTGVTIVSGERAFVAWNGSDFVKVGGAAGGTNTQVQYNNNGVFGGVSGATTNGTAITFSTTNLKLQGSSTGVSSFASANSSATDYTVTFPAASTTIPVATQTLTFSGPTAARTITLPDANFTAARTDSAQTFTGVQTFSSNPVLSGGTANGVLYLNGSNVATSGSALTYNGSTLTLNTLTSGLHGVLVSNGTAYSGLYVTGTGYSYAGAGANESWFYAANALNIGSDGNLPIKFLSNGSEQMRLTSTGLGIGTSSPVAKLQVSNAGAEGLEVAPTTGIVRLTAYNRSGGAYTSLALIGTSGTTQTIGSTGIDFNSQMLLNTSGNLGLGVTPSAWGTSSSTKAFQLPGLSLWGFGNTNAYLSANSYYNGTNRIYTTSSFATEYAQTSGQHQWYTAPSGTAGNAITFTQAMTLDASGNWQLGTTTASNPNGFGRHANIRGSSNAVLYIGNTGADANCMELGWTATESYVGNVTSIPLTFLTNNTERARITTGGDLLVGQTSLSQTTVGGSITGGGIVSAAMTASTSAANCYHLYSTGASAYRFYVGLGGTINATSTTISAISDQRMKENIQDLDVGLSAVMALRPRKFDWKEGKGKNIKGDRGWIAQEFEQIFPDMIDEWLDPAPAGEEPYKSVRADLIPVLVKAIQEQQALITSLTARVAALEGTQP